MAIIQGFFMDGGRKHLNLGNEGMKKCIWKICGGLVDYLTGRCYKCARSGNLKYELYVERKQMGKHHNWKSYGSNYKTKLRKENDDYGESRTKS